VNRADALELYRSLPLPDTSMEAWRFTDLRDFDPDAFGGNGQVRGTVPATEVQRDMLEIDVAGLARAGSAGLEVVTAPDGVEFAPLPEDHERLGALVGADDKFTAHNAASWQAGLLVRVPKGVELDEPLYVRIAGDEDGALFWRLLVVAEEGSQFSVIEEYTGASGYSNAAVELFVEQGAKLEYVSLQNLAKETWHFAVHRATVARDAELDWVAGGFGSRKGKIRIHNDLAGQGATSRVTGAYFADGTQHLDYDTFQQHHAPSTTSDFAFKGVLREQASVVWRGMIRVEEDAQKTNAYQENRNLILSPDAHADSIPGLEILANDVRCTHGATISQVDREQLFYAMSRGLTRSDAERLIVRGFFQDVLDRIELDPVREALADALEARIPRA
jgi:Fe-S cluster assembly protein SufD